MDLKGILFWAGFLVVCLIIIFISHQTKKQIVKDGIVVTGVISRITDEGSPEEIDIHVYARYTTEEGEEVEGIISNPSPGLTVGQKVQLKYHPKRKSNARLI